MKKVLLIISILFITLFLSLIPVRAAEGLVVLENSARADFPAKLTFHLAARDDSVISDIRLRYTVQKEQFARVFSEVFIEFSPSNTVSVDCTLEMVKIGGLPPGTGIDYWWLVKDTTGKQTSTTPARVSFDDSRYAWQSLTADKVTIYWYNGDKVFAQELMKIAEQALARLADYTGARIERQVSIYVYAKSSDLLGAMIYPQEWTGGVAFTRYGIISLTIGPTDLSWAKQVIPHELTHQVIDQIVLNPYNDLPTWLDEGLASYIEGEMAADMKTYLKAGLANNTLISVRSLCSPFSANRTEAALSYGQSYSLVEYLITAYGQNKMLELLNTFKNDSEYDAAFAKVYGIDMDGLDSLWREYVDAPQRQISAEVRPAASAKAVALSQPMGINPALAGGLAGLATALALFLALLWERWSWKRGI